MVVQSAAIGFVGFFALWIGLMQTDVRPFETSL